MNQLDQDQIWKSLVQKSLNKDEEKKWQTLLNDDESLKEDFGSYQKAHNAIEQLIAEDLRQSIRTEFDKKPNSKKPPLIWLAIGFLLLILGAFLVLQNTFSKSSIQQDAFASNEYTFRSSNSATLPAQLLESLKENNFEQGLRLVERSKNGVYFHDLVNIYLEKSWKAGHKEELHSILSGDHTKIQLESADFLESRLGLFRAYYYFKEGSKEEFERYMKIILEESENYPFHSETNDFYLLSSKPFSRLFL